jgi:hypothetical protein
MTMRDIINGGLAFFAVVLISLGVSFSLEQCAASNPARGTVDLTALELSCVDNARTPEESTVCRNAVRRAWMQTNGVDGGDLPMPKTVEGGIQ